METAINNSIEKFYDVKKMQNEAAELCLLYCGNEECNPGHRYGPNKRPSYLMHIVKKGKGRLEINDSIYYLKENDIFLIPYLAEAWYEADMDDPWSYSWIGFSGRKVEECVFSAGFSLRSPVRNVSDKAKRYDEHIQKMLDCSGSSMSDELKRNALLMMFFANLIEDYDESKSINILAADNISRTEYIRYGVQYIETNYQKKIRIQDLANLIGVERTYFATYFKKIMGVTPQEYLISYRMDRATHLLKYTELNINAIAESVGYDDPFAFSSTFRKRYGVSPTAYRNAQEPEIVRHKKNEFVKKFN